MAAAARNAQGSAHTEAHAAAAAVAAAARNVQGSAHTEANAVAAAVADPARSMQAVVAGASGAKCWSHRHHQYGD